VTLLRRTKLTKKPQENSTQQKTDQLKVGCNKQLAHKTGQTPHANQREETTSQDGSIQPASHGKDETNNS